MLYIRRRKSADFWYSLSEDSDSGCDEFILCDSATDQCESSSSSLSSSGSSGLPSGSWPPSSAASSVVSSSGQSSGGSRSPHSSVASSSVKSSSSGPTTSSTASSGDLGADCDCCEPGTARKTHQLRFAGVTSIDGNSPTCGQWWSAHADWTVHQDASMPCYWESEKVDSPGLCGDVPDNPPHQWWVTMELTCGDGYVDVTIRVTCTDRLSYWSASGTKRLLVASGKLNCGNLAALVGPVALSGNSQNNPGGDFVCCSFDNATATIVS